MAIELICEVLDHAPKDLSSAERLVLVVIAEAANKDSRKCWPKRETISRRTGLELSGLKKAFQRLAARGLEVRVPIGKDKTGRLVFAHEGHRSEYILPRFDFHSPGKRGDERHPSEAQEGGQAGPSGGTGVPKRRDGKATQTVREPSEEPSSSAGSDVRYLSALLGATDEEALLIIKKIKNMPNVKNPSAYIRGIGANQPGDLRKMLDEIRTTRTAEASRQEMAEHRARVADMPPCEHGTPGGHELSPNGWCTCSGYRIQRRQQRQRDMDPYAEPQDPRIAGLLSGWSE